MNAGEAAFGEICPYCDSKRGTTCDYLEPIKDICKCAEYRHCDYFQYVQCENGDSLQLALDKCEDEHSFITFKTAEAEK